MRFTSDICSFAWSLIKNCGYTKSDAFKMAFAKNRNEFETFQTLLNQGWVLECEFYAQKHQSNVKKQMSSLNAAIEAGLFVPAGGEKRPAHLQVYFDVTVNEARSFIKENFKGFKVA